MTDIEKLKNKLKAHDWYYEFSEDHKAWRKGLAERTEIYELLCRIKGPEVEPIVLECVPKDCLDKFVKSVMLFNKNIQFLKGRL